MLAIGKQSWVFYLWGIGKIFLRSFQQKDISKKVNNRVLLCFPIYSSFNHLHFVYFWAYHLDFQHTARPNFDIIWDEFLPVIADQIISLDLTNDHKIPNMFANFSFFVVSHTLNSIIYNHFRTLSISTSQYRSMSTL